MRKLGFSVTEHKQKITLVEQHSNMSSRQLCGRQPAISSKKKFAPHEAHPMMVLSHMIAPGPIWLRGVLRVETGTLIPIGNLDQVF